MLPKSAKKNQLFLLHFAGGNCYSFDFLKHCLSADFEFIPLELPGRGKRMAEKLLAVKSPGVQDYYEQIRRLRNQQKYLIYGHSMGATLGLSVAHLMEKIGDPPAQLIVSGNAGPDVKETTASSKKGKRYLMNDEDFKEELRELGGVPEAVLENEELYDFFSPILRADFKLLEEDDFSEKDIHLETPIFALMGSEEKTKDKIENWKRFTTSNFQYKVLKGDHFFIKNHPGEIAQVLKNSIKTRVAAGSGVSLT